ncbi:MAG: hypothetical protein KatS3mg105_3977 [Gemmatales bacterium]|nr:MAG: hypothetical protein KatS3mg105_3977 [Gemmatales bacterium]
MGHFLAKHWLSAALIVLAVVLAGLAYRQRQQQKSRSFLLFHLAGGLSLLVLGDWLGLALAQNRTGPSSWGLWLAGTASVIFFIQTLVLLVSSNWWAPLAYATLGLFLIGSGNLCLPALTEWTADVWDTLWRLEFRQPLWLLLLALLPAVVLISRRSLVALGPARRWLVIALRCLIFLLLILALAEVMLRQPNDDLTVLFVVDRSLSVPEEHDPDADPKSPRARVDLRWNRIKKFINESVEHRRHKSDQAGLIVFGRRPRLELPPSAVPRFNFEEVTSTIDNNYTDIAAAIKLALASFPEGTARRIVLISDGNENIGNVLEQARLAKLNDIPIDVIPLAAGYRKDNEVLVERVEAPPITEQSSQITVRVLIRNTNPNIVEGLLSLRQVVVEMVDERGKPVPLQRSFHVPGSPVRVRLRPGLNTIPFKLAVGNRQQSYSYEAVFEPERVIDEKGEVVHRKLLGDRVQNNRATTHVIALGQRRVLLVEPIAGDHRLLVDHLNRVGESRFQVFTVTADQLPKNKAELAVFLSNYDCIILANVPASDIAEGAVGEELAGAISEEQQEVIRSNTYDQGCGLIMIGGPNGFGAGGWQGTPIEKALPVDCDIKSLKIKGKGGLVLIMHASEMAEGNRWQKEIAKLAIRKLSPVDMFGMIYYDLGKHRWYIDFQTVGANRDAMISKVDRMSPGDMPDVDPAFVKARTELTRPAYDLATRHIIFISDGDHWTADKKLLARMQADKITCTTVCVTSHGVLEERKMSEIARLTGGRFYSVKSGRALPAIYTKETRLVSRSFVYEKRFVPRLEEDAFGPAQGLPRPLLPLYGFVRTTPKPSVLVHTPILGPPSGEQQFPILAYWHYGLGKVAAFTSDARSQLNRRTWDREWADSPLYSKFWEQLVGWAIRAVESGNLRITTDVRDGMVRVTVDARDKANKPLVDLNIRGGVTTPNPREQKKPLRFEQVNSGIYVAEFKAEEAGSYFIVAQPTRIVKTMKDGKEVIVEEGIDSVRTGITIPYSPEYSDMESNSQLLEQVARMTGGRVFADSEEVLAAAGREAIVFRHEDLPRSRRLKPIWYWLLTLAAVFLVFDVAVRRIAIEPSEFAQAMARIWGRLRGQTAKDEATPEFFDRLKTRKDRLEEEIRRTRAARRFEGDTAPTPPVPEAAPETPPPSRPASTPSPPTPQMAPEQPQDEPADFATRLMRAKKRVWEERGKDKSP